jgi:hypothetical protein
MPPAAVATPNLLVDPGWLFWAPLGTALPTNTVTASVFSDAWAGAWLPLGATVEGSTLSYESSVESMSVAEIFDPVKYATVSRSGSLAFALANWSLSNLKRALNGPALTVTGSGATTLSTLVLPTPGNEVRAMLGWESQDSTVRVIVYQALSSGTIEMAFQKAPDFAQIPFEFSMELPSGQTQPFAVFGAGVNRG